MKKVLSTVLILAMVLSLGLIFTGCGDSEPYIKYDLSEYITLPDYDSYEVEVPEVQVTDADIDEQIQKNLEAAAETTTVTEGTVEKGDTVTIKYEGTLEDGTTSDGMKSESSKLTLGDGKMIDGFEEGLYGATIGKEVSLDLTFPDPYPNSADSAGKGVTFKVTVLSKDVKDIPELTEEFVKENSEAATISEYRTEVAKALEQSMYDEELYNIKYNLYSKIVENTEVIKYPEKELKERLEETINIYEQKAETAGVKWQDYLKDSLQMSEDEFNKEAEEYAKQLVKQEMIIYALAEKEEVSVSEEELDTYLNSMLSTAGFADEKAFETYTGMTLKEYAKAYQLDRDLLLTKELDTIYDRLTDTEKE